MSNTDALLVPRAQTPTSLIAARQRAQPDAFFDLAGSRLTWIAERQNILAQNIANADTPRYVPRDIVPFTQHLDRASAIVPVRTDPAHLGGAPGTIATQSTRPQARAPDGNAVGVEGQMTEIADDETSALLVGNLWKSYMGMFMTALGRNA